MNNTTITLEQHQAAVAAQMAAIGGKADKPEFIAATLQKSGWKANTDTNTSQAYPYAYRLSVTGATSSGSADCIIAPANMATAVDCGLCASVDVSDGAITFYAEEAATANIAIQIRLIQAPT